MDREYEIVGGKEGRRKREKERDTLICFLKLIFTPIIMVLNYL